MAASYLIMKKQNMQESMIDEARTQFNSAAKPASGGTTSQDIRDVQAVVPKSTRFQDMNLKTPLAERKNLEAVESSQSAQVAAYENAVGLPEIQGVYFSLDLGH